MVIERSSNQLTDIVQGVTIDLVTADVTKPVTVTVARDLSTISGKINEFVTAFNDIVDRIDQVASPRCVSSARLRSEADVSSAATWRRNDSNSPSSSVLVFTLPMSVPLISNLEQPGGPRVSENRSPTF